ncbi:hypothetical protein HanXRQr2_Chr10g0429141 [Helianthus annuus]|uniref:Uncharacterized protein n=1 Tax=Helianthus annuus TaxID=4232 RepID=A0A9K3HVI9_HELAN|nr:hypothetical protein HanXRQr2_Chr10g0429141 [Helianthus annuus]
MTAPFIRFLNLYPCVNLQGIVNATTDLDDARNLVGLPRNATEF